MSSKKSSKKDLTEQSEAEKELAKMKQAARNTAWALSDSQVSANLTLSILNPGVDGVELYKLCEQSTKGVLTGNTQKIETMLMAQAHTLECLFHNMLRRVDATQHASHMRIYFDIAMKAQKQCRQTLSALVDIKNPRRATFVKQQNNAINQQINNGSDLENFQEKPANELLTEVQYETVDARGTFKASRADKELATVGKVHRG